MLLCRLLVLTSATLLLNACAAEPALPPGPEWKSGELRRGDDGSLQIVPGQSAAPARPAPARPAAARSAPASAAAHARPKVTKGRGTGAVVSWQAPKTYVDGKPIRGPLGYKVHYGQRLGSYPETVNAGGRTQVKVDDLEVGVIYYFVVTAYTADGTESSHSKSVALQLLP